jgi:hypothetical protein
VFGTASATPVHSIVSGRSPSIWTTSRGRGATRGRPPNTPGRARPAPAGSSRSAASPSTSRHPAARTSSPTWGGQGGCARGCRSDSQLRRGGCQAVPPVVRRIGGPPTARCSTRPTATLERLPGPRRPEALRAKVQGPHATGTSAGPNCGAGPLLACTPKPGARRPGRRGTAAADRPKSLPGKARDDDCDAMTTDESVAGANGNRTHQGPLSRPLTGFEDRAGHQPRTRSRMPCFSA